eukprot:gene13664-18336_t
MQAAKEQLEAPKLTNPTVGKSGKKICCSCPDTKQVRDNCTVRFGPDSEECKQVIEAHKACLRSEGFTIV